MSLLNVNEYLANARTIACSKKRQIMRKNSVILYHGRLPAYTEQFHGNEDSWSNEVNYFVNAYLQYTFLLSDLKQDHVE